LNTETGEIAPDRGNHAIKVTRGRADPPILRRVRYPVRYLARTWLFGWSGHLLPHRWLQRPSGTRQPGCASGQAAFRDELGAHA
jgi:hypothetical protein